MKNLIIYILLLFSGYGYSQILIDNKIEFTSTDSSKRAITNVSNPIDTSNLINATNAANNYINFIQATGTDSLIGQSQINFNNYSLGDSYYIKCLNNNTGSAYININNIGFKPILKNISDTLQENDILSNEIIRIIYDGNSFILISGTEKKCPDDFVSVNNSYCIGISKTGSWGTFWNAAQFCKDKGASLCSMSEWLYACQKSGLGLQDLGTSWEWLDYPLNNPNQGFVIGNGGCHNGNVINASATTHTRCCYRK